MERATERKKRRMKRGKERERKGEKERKSRCFWIRVEANELNSNESKKKKKGRSKGTRQSYSAVVKTTAEKEKEGDCGRSGHDSVGARSRSIKGWKSCIVGSPTSQSYSELMRLCSINVRLWLVGRGREQDETWGSKVRWRNNRSKKNKKRMIEESERVRASNCKWKVTWWHEWRAHEQT